MGQYVIMSIATVVPAIWKEKHNLSREIAKVHIVSRCNDPTVKDRTMISRR